MSIIRVSILVDLDTEGVDIEDLRDDILDVAFEQATDNPKLFLIQELIPYIINILISLN